MRIIHIVAGSGGHFYCQNCCRDMGLLKALNAAGHDVMFMPLYLPSMELAGAEGVGQSPVFYGAVNVYLDQKAPFYRRLPESIRRWLDAPAVLKWAAGKAGTTQAKGLGPLTLSVLQGRNGRQLRELNEMVDWLRKQPRPDIIHVSTALLLGLVPAVKEALNVPVVCTLQDEHTWLDGMRPKFRDRCWNEIRRLSSLVDLFLPVSNYYAAEVKERLNLPDERCSVVPVGIDAREFSCPSEPPSVPTIGFLSPFTSDCGLDTLAEAFFLLRRKGEPAGLRLRITGGDIRNPTRFTKKLRKRIDASGHATAVEFVDAYRQPDRGAFLKTLSVLSVPSRRPEAFGLFQIEAMACGVAVVQPRLGAYPEIIEATGGGVLFDENTPEGLADALGQLLSDREAAYALGCAGRQAVMEQYTLEHMAENMTAAYRRLLPA